MRALLINPKMPYAFWTMETSCYLTGAKALAPPLGLLTVAALLPSSWELRLIDVNTQNLLESDWQWADLVMIGSMLIQRDECLDLVRQSKKRGKTVVVGGPYTAEWAPEILEAGADIVVQGEGESQIPLLLEAIKSESHGIILKKVKRPEMTLSPVPRFDLINLDDYVVMNIQTSRGCPYNCEFCDVIQLFGRKPRYKSPDQVLAELEKLFNLGWRGQVFISDDNFIGNKTHAKAILAKLTPWMQEHAEPFYFWTQTSVNLGKDLQLIDLLTAANFGTVFIGVESTDAEVLSRSGKSHNKADELENWIHTINANGLDVVASFIMGCDGEKPGADAKICKIVEDCNLSWVMINLLTALPGTGLWKRYEEEGRLRSMSLLKDFTNFSLNYVPDRPEAEILAEWRQAIIKIYQPENYLRRACNYILNMRPTRSSLAARNNQPLPPPQSKRELNLERTLVELKRALKLFWLQGVKAPYRRQFWQQLWLVWRLNPSRLRKYLVLCAMGENGFVLRERVQKDFASHLFRGKSIH